MNKGLLKIALLSVVCGSMPVAFTSCKDYDDDIDRLNKEVAENKTAIDNISQLVSQGGVIKSVAPSADGKGIVITVDQNGKTETFTIKNGENGTNAKIWTIGDDGFWYEDGVKTSYRAIGEKGEPGTPGTPGTPGAPGEAGKPGAPGDYYKPNAEGFFDLYSWDASKGEYILKQKNAISYATANDHVTAVVTANDVFLKGIEGTDGVIVLAKTGALRGLVFKPDFYYQGIEAMDAATFKFNALKVNKVNADGPFGTDAPTTGSEVSMTPALVANYYLNPSSANIDNIFELSFITEDLEYSRAASGVTATIFDRSAKNGILTVKANLQGDIKAIDPEEMVTVLALKARLNEKAAATDTVITSDYAAVKASYYTDIDLSVPANASGVVLSNPTKPNHWYTTAAEAIAAEPALQIAWNNSQGLDLSKFIQADYTNSKGNHIAWSKPVNEYGFKYEYALVGYTDGNNQTSQSAHAALNPANNAIVRAQMPKDGKAQAWGAEQNKATLNRQPLVRVCLVDTVTSTRPVAAVAYVKLNIVEPGAVAPEDAISPVNFEFTKGYTVGCSDASEVFSLSWSQIEEKILATLNMSKATFEKNYDLRMEDTTNKIAQQVNVGADKSITNASVKYGVVTKKPDPIQQGTEVVSWTIAANDVYNYFAGSTKPKQMSVTVVYDGKPGTAYARNHVTITLKWTPSPLNVDPSATVDDNSKIAELWYTYNSATSASNGGKKEETHLNVAVPNNNLTPDACTFVNNLLYPFVGNQHVGLTGLDLTTYPDFATTKDGFAFSELANAPKEVKGMSGATYVLLPDGANLKAYLKGSSISTAKVVALIDNATYTVTYQENDYAKDLLNYKGAQELGLGETLAATVKVTAVNGCDKPIALSNNTYNVRFLRPIDVKTKDVPKLADAVDNGSSLEIAKYLEFFDWRNIKFTDANKYLNYYGVEGAFVGILNPNTGEVSIATDEDITQYVYTDLNGGDINTQKLSTVLPKIRLSYTPATSLSLSNFGVLNYKNGGNVLGYSFHIRVPFVVKYKWGYVKRDFIITIDPTIGQ